MFCEKCGSKASEGAAFCRSCGQRLSNTENLSPMQGNKPIDIKKRITIPNIIIALCLVVVVVFIGKTILSSSGNQGNKNGTTTGNQQKVQCLNCNGTGYLSCPDCSGTGERTGEWRAYLNDFEKQTCPTCNGTGRLTCSYCNGTGWR